MRARLCRARPEPRGVSRTGHVHGWAIWTASCGLVCRALPGTPCGHRGVRRLRSRGSGRRPARPLPGRTREAVGTLAVSELKGRLDGEPTGSAAIFESVTLPIGSRPGRSRCWRQPHDLHSYCPGARVSDGAGNLGSRWRKTVRDLTEQLQSPGPNMTLDREPLLIRYDRSRPAADVMLDPDAQHRLAPAGNLSSAPEFSEIFVLLAEGNDGRHVEVFTGEHRLGVLTAADSADFRAVLAAAKSQGKPVAGTAIRDRDADGAWALHVYRPCPT